MRTTKNNHKPIRVAANFHFELALMFFALALSYVLAAINPIPELLIFMAGGSTLAGMIFLQYWLDERRNEKATLKQEKGGKR